VLLRKGEETRIERRFGLGLRKEFTMVVKGVRKDARQATGQRGEMAVGRLWD
jgi:hypothetical protein